MAAGTWGEGGVAAAVGAGVYLLASPIPRFVLAALVFENADCLVSLDRVDEAGEQRWLALGSVSVDPQVARVVLNKVRLERTRQFGACYLGLELWKQLELGRFFEQVVDGDPVESGQDSF